MASPYKALYIWIKRTDLILGEAFAIFTFRFIAQILDFLFWLVCIFIFDGVTVKTENTTHNNNLF